MKIEAIKAQVRKMKAGETKRFHYDGDDEIGEAKLNLSAALFAIGYMASISSRGSTIVVKLDSIQS